MDKIVGFLNNTGFPYLTIENLIMWVIGGVLIYLAIRKQYEPYLLLPIGFGVFLVNMPLGEMVGDGQLLRIFYYGIQYEVIPPAIFLGLGAMTDFGPLIANPKTLFLGAGAQFGVFVAFFGAMLLGFTPSQAATIGIIGGADGPTTIFLANALAPEILGAVAVSAYSYMALVPIIIPPVVKLTTTKAEREIVMKQLRPVAKAEKVLFPIITFVLIGLLVPKSVPLLGMFMIGNLFREAGVVKRLHDGAQNEIMNITTILLGLAISTKMVGEDFLKADVLMILGLGLVAFVFAVFGGIMLAKLMNLFLKEKINPMIGAAGLSAVPMSARVIQIMGLQANPRNYLLMHAMGPNVAGVVGTLVAAGMFLLLLKPV